METAEEQRVHSPPASLVPRLHVLHARRLSHNNPLLPAAAVEDSSAGETILSGFTQLLSEQLLVTKGVAANVAFV